MEDRAQAPEKADRWVFEGFDHSAVGHLPSRHTIETWGDEQPGIAIRSERNDRVWVRYDHRNPEWEALTKALRGEESYSARLESVLVRKANALDRRITCDVLVGRSTTGGILLSVRPTVLDAPNQGFAIVLDRETALGFARAMEADTGRARRAVVAQLAHKAIETEVAHERSR